ncbi:MAG: EamA family transporter [Bacteroidetes bacterium]|nr:EamA family transporter [Bacteroidota bacterium]
MSDPGLRKAYIELHLAVFLFGFTGILGKLIQVDAIVLVWHRIWLTAIFMFLLVLVTRRWQKIPLKKLPEIALISTLIVTHWVLFYASIKLAGVSVAMICLSSITFFTAIFEPLVFKTRFVPLHFLFATVVIFGIYLMANDQQEQTAGIIVGIISAMFSSLFTVFNKRILPAYRPRMLSFVEMSLGFVMLTLMLPLFNLFFPMDFRLPSDEDWLYLILLSFFCTVVAFNLSLNALNKLSAFTVNLAINLEPVYAIILAFVFFKEYEMLGTGFYIGTTLILLSVIGDALIRRKARKPKLP